MTMLRALLLFALVLGVVLGGLLLLWRTAGMHPPKRSDDRKRLEIKPPPEDDDRGW